LIVSHGDITTVKAVTNASIKDRILYTNKMKHTSKKPTILTTIVAIIRFFTPSDSRASPVLYIEKQPEAILPIKPTNRNANTNHVGDISMTPCTKGIVGSLNIVIR